MLNGNVAAEEHSNDPYYVTRHRKTIIVIVTIITKVLELYLLLKYAQEGRNAPQYSTESEPASLLLLLKKNKKQEYESNNYVGHSPALDPRDKGLSPA